MMGIKVLELQRLVTCVAKYKLVLVPEPHFYVIRTGRIAGKQLARASLPNIVRNVAVHIQRCTLTSQVSNLAFQFVFTALSRADACTSNPQEAIQCKDNTKMHAN